MNYTTNSTPHTKKSDNKIRNSDKTHIVRALLFITPSVVTTIISISLFSLLRSFSPEEMNILLTTVMAAIILGLIGAAPIQLLIYDIIGEDSFPVRAIRRCLKIIIVSGIIYCIMISVPLYYYFTNMLGFSNIDFVYFVLLTLVLFFNASLTGIFWAVEKYGFTAIAYTISYIAIFFITYQTYLINPKLTMFGFILGFELLLITLVVGIVTVSPRKMGVITSAKQTPIIKLVSRDLPALVFQLFYVVAVFLDKVIIWVITGLQNGTTFLISGNYTIASFLGLTPFMSIAVMAYFTSATGVTTSNFFGGTLYEIDKRINDYKKSYWKSLVLLVVIAILLLFIVAFIASHFIDRDTLRTLMTIGCGTIFFSTIIFNTSPLTLFRKINISTISILIICFIELCMAPFVPINTWYMALGFTGGSIIGSVISQFVVCMMFGDFEYQLFRHILKNY